MRVGTLERLMAAGDTLAKVDASVEGVIRKIERAYAELNDSGEALTVDNSPVIPYLQNYRWSSAKYQATRPIEELVKLITQGVQKIDDELKEALGAYQEAKHELNALQRKRGGNLMANVNEYLKKVDPNLLIDTEYLTTILVVVPRNNFETFLEQYETLASDAVGYGPAEDRQSILGSPVVPRTAQKIAEDNDGYQLYRIIILKSFKDVYAQALQKARFTVRDIPSKPIKNKREEFDIEIQPANSKEEETEDESAEIKFADAENQFEQSRNQLRRWAKTHYGEAFIAWIHVKAIRTFVEAVLLYGLPVDFVAA